MVVEQLISGKEVAKHNTRQNCWIIVHGNVYDVTEFLDGNLLSIECWHLTECFNSIQTILVVVKLYLNMLGKMQHRNMTPFIHRTLSLQTFHWKNI